MRHLVLVLGDQLNRDSLAFDGFDTRTDGVWMAEVRYESTKVWSHKARIVMFLSAMRHFAEGLKTEGLTMDYTYLSDGIDRFSDALGAAIRRHQPERLRVVQPGEWSVLMEIRQTAAAHHLSLDVLPDTHFICSLEQFEQHASKRKQLRMEFFYRELRQQTGLLMENGKPLGGAWNYDKENRDSFGKTGVPLLPLYSGYAPDETTRQVIHDVEAAFPDNPGQLVDFDWPVTPHQAQQALADFLDYRLLQFGRYQDAMWTQQPFLFHARLSACLNLKLIDPLTVCQQAEARYRAGAVNLPSTEGFIRQVLGWREYVRGVYWRFMPDYLHMNALDAHQPLPAFYWTAETDMNCLRHTLGQTLQYGYAHHIQRLMITGLFALLLGVNPKSVHEWYLAVYIDAVEWVELPNTLGMSQFGDGGLMSSKPYAATGKYIQRMSNYCEGCRYNPAEAIGPTACPFTTLYWDFLLRHQTLLGQNPRMALQIRNVDRLSESDKQAIQQQAAALKHRLAGIGNDLSQAGLPV